jgi:hypothetical protein
LAASKDRVYCLTVTGRLAILDAKTGGRIALMGPNQLDVFFSNTLTDRILVGTATGVVQCLHEVELQWPLVHVNLAEAEQKRRPEIKQEGLDAKTKPAAKPAAPKPAADAADPFGGGGAKPAAAGAKPAAAGADPFGGGAAPKPAADPADPFGGGAKPEAGGAKPAAGGADPFGGAPPPPAAAGAPKADPVE